MLSKRWSSQLTAVHCTYSVFPCCSSYAKGYCSSDSVPRNSFCKLRAESWEYINIFCIVKLSVLFKSIQIKIEMRINFLSINFDDFPRMPFIYIELHVQRSTKVTVYETGTKTKFEIRFE